MLKAYRKDCNTYYRLGLGKIPFKRFLQTCSSKNVNSKLSTTNSEKTTPQGTWSVALINDSAVSFDYLRTDPYRLTHQNLSSKTLKNSGPKVKLYVSRENIKVLL